MRLINKYNYFPKECHNRKFYCLPVIMVHKDWQDVLLFLGIFWWEWEFYVKRAKKY